MHSQNSTAGRESGDYGLVQSAGEALINGNGTALMVAAAVLLAAALITGVLINARK